MSEVRLRLLRGFSRRRLPSRSSRVRLIKTARVPLSIGAIGGFEV